MWKIITSKVLFNPKWKRALATVGDRDVSHVSKFLTAINIY